MRPAAAFAELAARFESSVCVYRQENQPVDGKNWLELLLLAAGPGTKLTLEVNGTDASEGLEALAEVLATVPPPDDDDSPKPSNGDEG